MSRQPRVVLLRSPQPDDPYEAALREAGFDARFLPVLRYDFINLESLAAHVAARERYEAMALTSPRAVEALEASGRAGDWGSRAVFAVGPTTAGAASGLGLKVRSPTPGTAEELVRVILGEKVRGPVLFPCGNRRREVLPRALRRAGVAVREVIVYRTELLPPALPEGRVDWAVFFSPSGVEAALAAPDFPWNRLRTAAIGPTTAETLGQAGASPAAVAEEPTPASLARALQGAELHRSDA